MEIYKSCFNKEAIKNIPNVAGVYRILNLENGKSYVGSSIHIRDRLLQHYRGDDMRNEVQRRLKKGLPIKYVNEVSHLQLYDDIQMYGYYNFEVQILFAAKYIPMKELRKIEYKFINEYDCIENGYNKYHEDEEY